MECLPIGEGTRTGDIENNSSARQNICRLYYPRYAIDDAEGSGVPDTASGAVLA
jgi:hypothetical protein